MRAVRPDKMTLAALEATLEIYREGRAAAEIPALRMIASAPDVLASAQGSAAGGAGRALVARRRHGARRAVGRRRRRAPRRRARELDGRARGAVDWAPTRWRGALLAGDPPVVARIGDDRVLLDVRTLSDDEIDETATAVARAVQRVRT